MRYVYFLLVMSLLLVPAAYGDPAVAEGTDIAGLIRQLGDDVPKVREQATVKLRQLGRAALAALAEAQNDSDPEVVARAQLLTRQIDEDLHPRPRPLLQDRISPAGLRLNRIAPGGNAVVRVQAMRVGTSRSVSMTRSPDGGTVKETVVKENGQEIKIREAADGITLTTTKTADGKEISTVVKAKDKDALKKDNPEAYALYERQTNAAMPARVGQLDVDRRMLEMEAQTRVEVERALADAERRVAEHQLLIEAQQRLIERRVREERQRLDEQRKQQEQ
jgi:hypothetical protein